MIQILADENIPFAEEAFGTIGRVQLLPGRAIDGKAVSKADVLLVRSVTPIGPALLGETSVEFVGSATAGTDHVDTGYLREWDLPFAHAPGANANSVVEYVLAALVRLAVRRGEALRGKTVGIVGVGAVGGRLAERLPAFGVQVLRNDPPRAGQEGKGDLASLNTVLAESDIVTLHTPLTRDAPHPTYHLIGEAELEAMNPSAWLINAARGAVVDHDALDVALRDEQIGAAVIDTWEQEPTPDPDLLRRVDLATPHIAGYAFDGKVQGTVMLYEALCRHLEQEPKWDPESVLAPLEPLRVAPPDPALPEREALHWIVRQMYDPYADDERMRGLLKRPPAVRGAYFQKLRKAYPRRRAFARYQLPSWGLTPSIESVVKEGLNVHIVPTH